MSLNDGLREAKTGVLGMEKPAASCSMGDIDDIAIGAIPLLGVWNEDRGGIDGGGIGLIKLDPLEDERGPRPRGLSALRRFEQEASLKFWRSLEGVLAEVILWLGLDMGEIREDTALLRRLLVGVLLKLNARLT